MCSERFGLDLNPDLLKEAFALKIANKKGNITDFNQVSHLKVLVKELISDNSKNTSLNHEIFLSTW